MVNNNYLFDKDFLRLLDLYPHKTIYGKIILLTQDEAPVSEIQGKITSGSINIDGASSLRRTCSLSMVATKLDNTEDYSYFALKNKFKLEVGVENHIDSRYPDIIWFKQGIYVFTSVAISVQATNFSINLNGKDKMCNLNGDIAGSLESSVDFGNIEDYEKVYTLVSDKSEFQYEKNTYYYKNDNIYTLDTSDEKTESREYYSMEIIRTLTPIIIKKIIQEAVCTYGKERLENIVLNDIDDYGLELLEYRGDRSLYMYRLCSTGEVKNVTFNEEQPLYINEKDEDENYKSITIKDNEENIIFYNRNLANNEEATKIWFYSNEVQDESKAYQIIEVKPNETVGYRKTELTYPGDLIGNIGESLTSILDKIKNMFSDFEYFYDVDGRFIFQKKKTYENNTWLPVVQQDSEIAVQDLVTATPYVYSFDQDNLITAFSNTPNILNIRNDFSIWGTRKSSSGADIPIHIRYAIDKKPIYYKPINLSEDKKSHLFISYENEQTYNEEDTIVVKCDWREIIYQMALDYFKYGRNRENFELLVKTANPQHYPTGVTGYESYYTDMYSFWRQIYNPAAIGATSEPSWVELSIAPEEITTALFSTVDGFSQDYKEAKELLNFDFDFLEVSGELGKYQVSQIGQRTKSINESNITAIQFQEIPKVLFKSTNNKETDNYTSGYTTIQLSPNFENYFSISAQGLSAKDKLYELLNQHISYSENITITSIPIYHLEPNNKIYVSNLTTGIEGEYIVNKITIPLAYNGTSSINAIKVLNKIY